MHNAYVTVHVDLQRIRDNVRSIAKLAGVPILAVVKADGYGLGAARVAEAIADQVERFCVFDLAEALDAGLYARTGKRVLALGPPTTMNPADFKSAGVTPSISTVEQAVLLRAANPALCVDTGMQRFACPPDRIDAVIHAGDCREAFTHGTRIEHALRLQQLCAGRGLKLHAAASALLHAPEAMLDAIRPGLAMYRGAARVATTLVETHDTTDPAGYSGFVVPRHGVILMGYSHGLRRGFCTVNQTRRRVLEVGMQSAFVEIGADDRIGDPVHLLDEIVDEQVLSEAWGTSPQEVLVDLCAAGRKLYAH
jgi:alanine racemase